MNLTISKTSLILAASLPFLAACDNIAEEDRFLEYDRPPVERNIVIFEFTGQTCRNCPDGAAAIHNILESKEGQVFAVNLHPENTTYTKPLGNIRLTSPEASFLYNYYQPQGFPAACINGTAPNSNPLLWGGFADDALAMPAPASLELTTEYNKVSRELTIHYNTTFDVYSEYEILLQLYIVEDGIVGMQQSMNGLIRDYVHNHVLRTTAYKDWGLSLGDTFAVHQQISGDVSVTLDDSWVADNCSVVGCLIKESDKTFLQTNGAYITSDANNAE